METEMNSMILTYHGYLLPFEKSVNDLKLYELLLEYRHYAYYATAIYLFGIFMLEKYMANRPPFKLDIPLVIWDFGIAAFNILATWRIFIVVFGVMYDYGYVHILCYDTRYKFLDAWLFMCSMVRILEFGDTLFIILRKKPLTFLHYFHHASVVFFAHLHLETGCAAGKVMCLVNSAVHTILYLYYGFCALKVPVPGSVRMFITSAQILQLGYFFLLFVHFIYLTLTGFPCPSKIPNFSLPIVMLVEASLIALFVKFFYNEYIKPSKTGSQKKTK